MAHVALSAQFFREAKLEAKRYGVSDHSAHRTVVASDGLNSVDDRLRSISNLWFDENRRNGDKAVIQRGGIGRITRLAPIGEDHAFVEDREPAAERGDAQASLVTRLGKVDLSADRLENVVLEAVSLQEYVHVRSLIT